MKKIGNIKYIHRSAKNQLNTEERKLVENCELLLTTVNRLAFFDFEIIKIDLKNKSVTFIESEDWDIASEPVVGDAHKITLHSKGKQVMYNYSGDSIVGDYKLTKKKNNPQIYHHKWMFVNDDYTGFDVVAAKQWSDKWTSVIPKGHANKYGYKNYWLDLLKQYGLSY